MINFSAYANGKGNYIPVYEENAMPPRGNAVYAHPLSTAGRVGLGNIARESYQLRPGGRGVPIPTKTPDKLCHSSECPARFFGQGHWVALCGRRGGGLLGGNLLRGGR